MKKLKFLKIFLISFAVFCTISIGAVSSYLFFADVASSQTTGVTITDPWTDYAANSVTKNNDDYYEISTASELAWVSKMVNDDNPNYGNINVILTKDIDLFGHNWDDSDSEFLNYYHYIVLG